MAKSKKGSSKPSVKVRDMKAKKNPKGGAVDAFSKVQLPVDRAQLGDIKLDPYALNLNKYKKA